MLVCQKAHVERASVAIPLLQHMTYTVSCDYVILIRVLQLTQAGCMTSNDRLLGLYG